MVVVHASSTQVGSEPLILDASKSETSELGPGQYEITQETPILEEPRENSKEIRLAEVGDVLTILEVAPSEGNIYGRVNGGWLVLRDDLFDYSVKPISSTSEKPEFGQPGRYRLLGNIEVTLEREPQSLEVRITQSGEILDITSVEEFDGLIRGKFFQGWVTLRSDMFDCFASIYGRLPENASKQFVVAQFGEPGKYEIIVEAVCTELLNTSSEEISVIPSKNIVFVTEVKEFEGSRRGHIEDGWITLRDDMFEYFAKPWDPRSDPDRPRIPMIFTNSTFNLNSGWFKVMADTAVFETADSDEPFFTLSSDKEIHIVSRTGKWAQVNSPVQGYLRITDDNDKVVLRELDYGEMEMNDESEDESSDIIIGGDAAHTGMYEIILTSILTEEINPGSAEIRALAPGDVVSIEELARYEGCVRVRIENRGWFSLRDDMFQEFAKPIIHSFGELGDYVLLEDVVAQHDADPASSKLRLIIENETVKIRKVQEIQGMLRGECEYGWISLQDDKGKQFVRVKTSGTDVPEDHEFGEPGKYKLVTEGVLTQYRSVSSEELCVIPQGVVVRVTSVKDVEGMLRGKLEFGEDMGWLTLRDDVFEVFAEPISESEKIQKDKESTSMKLKVINYDDIGGSEIRSDYSLPDTVEKPPPNEPMTPIIEATKPGQYRLLKDVDVTDGISLSSKTIQSLEKGAVVFLVEIAEIQSNVRGRVEGGWLTVSNEKEEFAEVYSANIHQLFAAAQTEEEKTTANEPETAQKDSSPPTETKIKVMDKVEIAWKPTQAKPNRCCTIS